MNAPAPRQGGTPLLPDEFSDERLFRARTVTALRELFRRMGEAQHALEQIQKTGGR